MFQTFCDVCVKMRMDETWAYGIAQHTLIPRDSVLHLILLPTSKWVGLPFYPPTVHSRYEINTWLYSDHYLKHMKMPDQQEMHCPPIVWNHPTNLMSSFCITACGKLGQCKYKALGNIQKTSCDPLRNIYGRPSLLSCPNQLLYSGVLISPITPKGCVAHLCWSHSPASLCGTQVTTSNQSGN